MAVVPLLPCASIDDMLSFYTALGFEQTYRQTKPNPALAMRRGDIDLQFFGMPGFNPADSYGSCIITVPDTAELHRVFSEGLRSLYGKVPLSGIPRMTRPRARKNAEGLAGFSVVDPGGNWLRIYPDAVAPTHPQSVGKLAQALDNAVVLADSRGDPAQAAKILDGALAKALDATTVERVEALAYRAELAFTLQDPVRAAAILDELDGMRLDLPDRERLADTLAAIAELRRDASPPKSLTDPP